MNGHLSRFWRRNGGDNYCGPYYTAGKLYGETFDEPALSELDQLCLDHDRSYAEGHQDEADHVFIARAKKLGPRGAFFRAHDRRERQAASC